MLWMPDQGKRLRKSKRIFMRAMADRRFDAAFREAAVVVLSFSNWRSRRREDGGKQQQQPPRTMAPPAPSAPPAPEAAYRRCLRTEEYDDGDD